MEKRDNDMEENVEKDIQNEASKQEEQDITENAESDKCKKEEKEEQEEQEENKEENKEISEVDKYKAQADEYLDKWKRGLAEFDNFRKRTALEKTFIYENGARDCVQKLLPILDNFERAISSTKEEEKEMGIYKGVEMIYTQMLEAFTQMGVKEIEGVGVSFDPNMHNAVMHIDDESLGENVVAEVLQKGYMYGDKVLRPSMVKVAN